MPRLQDFVLPDVPNWSWHEYGIARWGVAFSQSLQKHRDRAPTLSINARGARIIRAWRSRQGWQLGIPGPLEQGPIHKERPRRQ